MSRLISRLPLLAVLTVAVGLPGAAAAGGLVPAGANGCPSGTVCDHALGVALMPPSGWQRVPAGHFPVHTLAWFVLPPLGQDYNIRLLVGPDGTTTDHSDAHAAARAADTLIAGYPGHVHPTRYTVRYGGAPGVLMHGLPGGPGPDVFIILGHRGALYSIIAPGTTLGPDQQQALGSMRFIPRVGPFPSGSPPTRKTPPVHRTVPGGVFSGDTLTLTRQNGLRGGKHTYSLWFQTRDHRQWKV